MTRLTGRIPIKAPRAGGEHSAHHSWLAGAEPSTWEPSLSTGGHCCLSRPPFSQDPRGPEPCLSRADHYVPRAAPQWQADSPRHSSASCPLHHQNTLPSVFKTMPHPCGPEAAPIAATWYYHPPGSQPTEPVANLGWLSNGDHS